MKQFRLRDHFVTSDSGELKPGDYAIRAYGRSAQVVRIEEISRNGKRIRMRPFTGWRYGGHWDRWSNWVKAQTILGAVEPGLIGRKHFAPCDTAEIVDTLNHWHRDRLSNNFYQRCSEELLHLKRYQDHVQAQQA